MQLKDLGETVDSADNLAIYALQTGGNWENGATWTGGVWNWSLLEFPKGGNNPVWPDMYKAYGNDYGVHWWASASHSKTATLTNLSSTGLLLGPAAVHLHDLFEAPSLTHGTWRSLKKCSVGYAVCGVSIQDYGLDISDNVGMVGLRFTCCSLTNWTDQQVVTVFASETLGTWKPVAMLPEGLWAPKIRTRLAPDTTNDDTALTDGEQQ